MLLSIITAMDRNRLIGNDNGLPWHLPADFAWFKQVTMGKPIVMGRKTWESIGRPLPGRTNIVLTRNPELKLAGAHCVNSLAAAKRLVEKAPELMIIGGSAVYEMAMPLVQRLYVTHIDGEFEGDAWFPQWGDEWYKLSSQYHPADDKNACDCEFAIYEKAMAAGDEKNPAAG